MARKIIGCSFLLALLANPVFADFHVEDSASPDVPVSQAPAIQSGVFAAVVAQNGTPDNFAIVRGFARSMPLSIALQQVVPTSFKVVSPDEYSQKSVSWQGGRPWLDVIGQVATAAGLDVDVDWNVHVVTLRPAPEALMVAQAASAPGALPANYPAIDPVAAAPASVVEHIWILDPALTLRENVKEWATKAGWTVLWTAVDYQVTAKTTLSGDFDSATGPVHELAIAYEKAQQPLAFEMFRTNHVLRVRSIISQKGVMSPLATDPTSINPDGPSPDPDAHHHQ